MKLQEIDIRTLNEKAKKIFEASDTDALNGLFGNCKSIEEINDAADDLYSLIIEGNE